MTDFAYNRVAVEGRQRKAMLVAEHLHAEKLGYWDVLALVDEDDRKAAEKAVKVRTSHRDDLWALVVVAFEWLLANPPAASEPSEDDRQRVEYEAREAAAKAKGECPDSGLLEHACHLGPCDCFQPQSCAECLLIPLAEPEPEPVYPVLAPTPVVFGGPEESDEDRATECRCLDPLRTPKHLAWHRLVIEQGGPAGVVNMQSLQEAKGLRTAAPNDHKTQEKNRRMGKTTSAAVRKKMRS